MTAAAHRPLAVVLAVACLAIGGPASAGEWTGDLNLLLGAKGLDKGDWGPAHRQGEFGLQTSLRRKGWPVYLAADLLTAEAQSESVLANGLNRQRNKTSELDLGARKFWSPGPKLRPYLGGGLSLASGSMESASAAGTFSDRDGGAGLWLGGGVGWTLGTAFNVGFDAKLSLAEVKLLGDRKNAGGFHLGIVSGYHWGGGASQASPEPPAPPPAAPLLPPAPGPGP